MAESLSDLHLNYIKKHLLPDILQKLPNETLESYEIEHSSGLDGFMSALYTIHLRTKLNETIKQRVLISKFMKGDDDFRNGSKSYTQFANEIYIYNTVLPAYEEMLQSSNVSSTFHATDWVPPTYVAKFGYIEGLSEHAAAVEAVLVLENLKPLGYTLGPRLSLNKQHLLSMCKPIAEYHACSYILRLTNNELLEQLIAGIVPLPFVNANKANDDKHNLYRVLYRIAFDRFYEFFNRKLAANYFNETSDFNLIDSVKRLEQKYFENPIDLLETIRTNVLKNEHDAIFAAILHGDYNRNNVLFRYAKPAFPSGQSDELPLVEHVKMIDFQEMRYGTPAIDLSFFMFFNSTPEMYSIENWMQLLETYHTHMFSFLSSVLKAKAKNEEDLKLVEEQLEQYSFDHFNWHFSRYAFYGVLVCMHFLPWMLSSEQECARLAELWETDMHSPEFYKLSLEAGGDAVNFKILDVVRHACDMGYLNFVLSH